MRYENKVKRYFEVNANSFDEIYNWMNGTSDKYLKILLNKLLRKAMVERFKLILKECEPNKSILDIGCGSGRISIELAKKGAIVTGIDYSLAMINLANVLLKNYEKENNIKLKVRYLFTDFMKNFNNKELFDLTLALGVFDYIENPIPFLKKMKNLSREKLIGSFPAKLSFKMPIRKIWLWSRKCPVYFYAKKKISLIFDTLGITDYKIIKMPSNYFVKAKISKEIK